MIYECPICQSEESRVTATSGSALRCTLCGTALQVKAAETTRPASTSSRQPPLTIFGPILGEQMFSMLGQRPESNPLADGLGTEFTQLFSQINADALFDLIDPSLRDMFQQMMNDESPNKVVNQKYLDEIGILTVDPKKTVLWDVSIAIGPVHALFVLADFSIVPPANSEINSEIILGTPIHGEVLDGTLLETTSNLEHTSLLLQRGKITFAQKYQTYSSLPALDALIISQTNGYKFPFIMTDNSKELQKINPEFVKHQCQTRFPVGMISERDAEVIQKLVLTPTGKDKKPEGERKGCKVPIKIKVGGQTNECPVCVETFECGEEIFKLSCRHIYHKNCLSRWVQSHPNCPLCRKPIDNREKSEDGKSSGRPLNPTVEMANNFYS